jgi:hypothetical protein
MGTYTNVGINSKQAMESFESKKKSIKIFFWNSELVEKNIERNRAI